MKRTRVVALLLATFAAFACTGTDTGNPGDPLSDGGVGDSSVGDGGNVITPPSLDIEGLSATPAQGGPGDENVEINGGPDSITNLDGDPMLLAWNLEGTEPPLEIEVEEDGSFEAVVSAVPGDELRFEAKFHNGTRMTVAWLADAVVVEDGAELAIVAPTRPVTDCIDGKLTVVVYHAREDFEMTNTCSDSIWFTAGESRLNTASAPEPAFEWELPGGSEEPTLVTVGLPLEESVGMVHYSIETRDPDATGRLPVTLHRGENL